MKLLLSLMLIAPAAPAVCIPVATDRIAVRDLLGAVPQLSALDPQIELGYSPFPGTERIIFARELESFARRHNVSLNDPRDLCVVRRMQTVSNEELHAALLAALDVPAARLDILEFTTQPLPPGRLQFLRSGLNQPPRSAPESPVLWRGKLMYDPGHSLPVWAKVKISINRIVFSAAQEIPAKSIVSEAQIRSSAVTEFPFTSPEMQVQAEIAGKIARQTIHCGQRLSPAMFEEAKAVYRGDLVKVNVIDGAAAISFDAIAASDGRKGESILMRNRASGRNFRAIVDSKGKAVVRPSPGD